MGIMGCQYASLLLSGTAPSLELSAVTRIGRNQKGWERQELPPEFPVFQSGKELIDKAEVDAVIVATPHYDHEFEVIPCLRKGIHVLCEKPLGAHILQAERMIQEESQTSAVFAIMLQQRAAFQYQKLREIVRSGKYGKVRRFNWIVTDWYRPDAYYHSSAWRATWAKEGGGVLLNQATHNIDIIQWIFGMPEYVMAFCKEGRWHSIEVEDDATIYMEFPDGVNGIFTTSTGDRPGVNRLEIDMDRAQIVCEDEKICIQEPGRETKCFTETVTMKKQRNLYEIMLNNFAAVIQGKDKLIAPGREGMTSLMMINAIYLSSWRKQIVNFPLRGEEYLREFGKKLK